LPPDSTTAATANWPGDITATYPAMSAQDTFNMMVSQPLYGRTGCDTLKQLSVTRMRLGTAQFETDRGHARITVWFVTVPGNAYAEIAYPAIRLSAFWASSATVEHATISADGRYLTFSFPGTQGVGRYGNSYNGLVAESTTAVEIAVQRIPNPTSIPDTTPAVQQQRSVVVALQAPLGGRIVVDAAGYVVPVCPASAGLGC
jgi:hypothetical protein